MRPWKEFLPLDKTKYHTKYEKTYQTTLQSNLAYYLTNYLIVTGVVMLYVCYLRPWFLLSLSLCIGTWYYVFMYRATPFAYKGRVVTRKESIIVFSTGKPLALLAGLVCGWSESLLPLMLTPACVPFLVFGLQSAHCCLC